jgi:glycosyltransferase involved in cell wall biosynthesis
MRINIIGPIFDTTGYSLHTRNLANALYKIADVKLSTFLIQDWPRIVNDAELDMITKVSKENDTNIIISTPHNWKLFLGTGINAGYCVWEGDKVPLCFIDEMLNPKINYIFVPSEHTKNAIINTIKTKEHLDKITSKLKVIPHGVDLTKFYKKNIQIQDNIFRFVCAKGWRGTSWDRGGVQYVIKAFNEEFKKEEQVQLLIKLNPSYINADILQHAIANLNLTPNKAPINIRLDDAPYEKLVDFYNQGNVFVCATRSEAFNLPGIEAMACGLPTIQTNFGGQTDYMTNKNSLFVDYKLEEVKEDIMYRGIKWATPDISDLRKKMRYAFENQDIIKKMGNQALKDVKNWTWEKSAKKIIEIFEKN